MKIIVGVDPFTVKSVFSTHFWCFPSKKKKRRVSNLFASVLSCFLVWLCLLSSVQGILLVELEHLHLLLDGIHGCLLLFGSTDKTNRRAKERDWRGGESLCLTEGWAGLRALPGSVLSNMYFQKGGDRIPLDIQSFGEEAQVGAQVFFKELLRDS